MARQWSARCYGVARQREGSRQNSMLVTKLVLFAGMLALAVSNRFWIVPSLAKARTDRLSVWTARLRNHVLCEQLLGLIVLLIVSVLGTMRPAIGQ
jgi:copper resistance protein D